MLKRITHAFIYVLDQDEALDFYVGKLGMVVHTDADLGVMRWLTVSLPDEPDHELVLMVPGPPAYDDETADADPRARREGRRRRRRDLRRPTTAAARTSGCAQPASSSRRSRPSASTEPTAALRDPFGNPIRFTQPPDGPIVVPSTEELRAGI